MGTLADHIEAYIKKLLQQGGNQIELNRAQLAELFSCVPSQINYVLTTRFTQDRGYVIESRRGGGGYIRIVKVRFKKPSATDMLREIGSALTAREVEEFLLTFVDVGAINPKQAQLIRGIIQQECATISQGKDTLRASLLRALVFMLLHES